MAFGESVAGAGFEVWLKSFRFGTVGKPDGCHDSPGAMLRRVWRLASVMVFKAIVQVGGQTNVAFTGEGLTLEDKRTWVAPVVCWPFVAILASLCEASLAMKGGLPLRSEPPCFYGCFTGRSPA